MKRVGVAVLCVLLVAFMLLVPSYVKEQVDQDIYLQWMSGQRGWEGVLRVWHVVSFSTATGSDGAAWLAARAREYEKKHFGLFIEIQTMTPAGAANRLEAGESPDLWSFPSGFAPSSGSAPSATFTAGQFTPDSLCAFRAGEVAVLPELLPGLLKTGKAGGEQLAIPYSMGGYLLLWNTDLLDGRDVQPPDLAASPPETWTAETLAAAVKAATYTQKTGKKSSVSHVGFCYAAGHRAGLTGLIERMPRLTNGEYAAGEEHFVNGMSAFCAGTTGTLGAVERKEAAGNGFSVAAEPAGRFTDCVQYIAVSAGLQEERERNAKDFAFSLLRDKGQALLATFGALPVSVAAADANLAVSDAYAPVLRALAELLRRPVAPNAFAWSGQRDRLSELCPAVLAGDTAAIAKFRATMLE